MPQSMPTAPVLLTAAIKYLEQELLPTLTGYHRFQTRVTANVLNTVRRELELRLLGAPLEDGRTEADAEALDAHLRPSGHEEVAGLVDHDQQAEAQDRKHHVHSHHAPERT